jgi:hypothetical protein
MTVQKQHKFTMHNGAAPHGWFGRRSSGPHKIDAEYFSRSFNKNKVIGINWFVPNNSIYYDTFKIALFRRFQSALLSFHFRSLWNLGGGRFISIELCFNRLNTFIFIDWAHWTTI